MGIPELSLRVRIFLFFALMMVASVVIIGSAIYMAHQSEPEQLPRLLATYTGVAATIIVLVLLLVWQLFDRYVAAALQSLARQMQTALHADTLADEQSFKDREQYQYLGSINDAADELIAAYRTLKIDHGSSANDNGAGAFEAHQLATILRDLSVGVLVMNRQHEILLYNQRAFRMINRPDCVGIARSALSLFEGSVLLDSFNKLLDKAMERQPCAGIEVSLTMANDSRHFTGKIDSIVNDDDRISGYVLLLDDSSSVPRTMSLPIRHDADAQESSPEATPISILPPRPEFFDFDLFDRPLPADMESCPLRLLDFVVFDTETTGLNPSGGDQMISIGAVRIVNGRVLTGECFDELVCPGVSVPAKSTVFHGITDDMLEGKPTIKEILPKFAEFVGKAVLVAHNAAFDMKFIELQSEKCEVNFVNPVLDTVLLSAFVHDHTNLHTLDDLAKRYGIDIEGRHSALGDAMATAHVFIKLVEQLSSRKVTTLNEAMNASNKMTHIKRHQKSY